MRTWQYLMIGSILTVFSLPAFAQIPDTLGFQGRLNLHGGGPVDSVVAITFSIYNQQNGGVPLFTEFHPSVVVTNSKFSVELGSVDPVGNPLSASLDFNEKYSLGITVAGDSEMMPRLPFNSVAYAQRAASAAKADEAQQSNQSENARMAETVDFSSFTIKTELYSVLVHPFQPAQVTTSCPAPPSPDKVYLAIAGGYDTFQGFGKDLIVESSRPVTGGYSSPPPPYITAWNLTDQWLTRLRNTSGSTKSSSFTVYVTCALASVAAP